MDKEILCDKCLKNEVCRYTNDYKLSLTLASRVHSRVEGEPLQLQDNPVFEIAIECKHYIFSTDVLKRNREKREDKLR